jgi:hypothetical protein
LVCGTMLGSAANAASVREATTRSANNIYTGHNSGPINTGRDICEGHNASAAPSLGCNDGGF